jgi:hypothetical protein
MPSLPTATTPSHLHPGSWPPAPGRLTPSLEDDNSTDDDEFDLPLLQRDPLTYFLTPPTPMDDDLEFDFDFDAGIEDPNNPPEIIRSVSPSTLDGLKRYKSGGKSKDCAILDDDSDDEEDYIRFKPNASFPSGLPDYIFDRPKSASTLQSRTTDALLSPNSFHVGSPRGRPARRFSPPRRVSQDMRPGLSLQRRHSWREPSPDVWSIDEEPEKETMSERGLSSEDLQQFTRDKNKTQPINIPAAKPKKRVRFILPAEE